MLSIKNENIIDHIAIVEPTSSDKLPLIVMEFMEGETLRDRLMKSDKIELEVILDWALQIAKGMSFLHEKEILHRDISSKNIMISFDFNSGAKLKIIDIGDENVIGTPLNMAPEAFSSNITKESDVFSFGTILWEIVTCLKVKPFNSDDLSPIQIAYKVFIKKQTLEIPENCDEKLSHLMHDCWKYEPKERPTFNEICQRLESQKIDLLKSDNKLDCKHIPENLPVFLFMEC